MQGAYLIGTNCFTQHSRHVDAAALASSELLLQHSRHVEAAYKRKAGTPPSHFPMIFKEFLMIFLNVFSMFF